MGESGEREALVATQVADARRHLGTALRADAEEREEAEAQEVWGVGEEEGRLSPWPTPGPARSHRQALRRRWARAALVDQARDKRERSDSLAFAMNTSWTPQNGVQWFPLSRMCGSITITPRRHCSVNLSRGSTPNSLLPLAECGHLPLRSTHLVESHG
jgi:hypothetical protein